MDSERRVARLERKMGLGDGEETPIPVAIYNYGEANCDCQTLEDCQEQRHSIVITDDENEDSEPSECQKVTGWLWKGKTWLKKPTTA